MPQLDDDVIIDSLRRIGYLDKDEKIETVGDEELEMFRSFAKIVQVKSNEGFLEWLTKHGTQVQIDLFRAGG